MQEVNNENTLPTRSQPAEATHSPEETLPMNVHGSSPETSEPVIEETRLSPVAPEKPVRPRRWPWFLLGFLLIVLFGAGGGYLGYRSAIKLRVNARAEQVVTRATEQFMLGLQAQQNGEYSLARRYFEGVIALDPKFPGATDKLTEVLVAMMATETPTPQPTPTLILPTPTPDMRTQEEIFNSARQLYSNQDWDNLMLTIDSLRSVDPGYRSIDIDGMLYVALRFRGIRKIYQEANLEGGIYDLALAERYAPLDGDALGARTWARLYLNGVSFWGADWARVVEAFEQIYPYFPNLRDSTGKTAVERYREASLKHADALAASGDACSALDYYNKALEVAPNGDVEATATAVYLICHPPTETPSPSETPTITPTLEQIPVETTPAPPVDPTPVTPPADTAPAPTEETPVTEELPPEGITPEPGG
jgi:tetratricopeptide (TPR) repeat protein